jgi:hypothetical protein
MSDGLLDLPDQVYQLVQEAQEAAGKQDWDTAIKKLKESLKAAGKTTPPAIKKLAAVSLANRGVSRANRAVESLNEASPEKLLAEHAVLRHPFAGMDLGLLGATDPLSRLRAGRGLGAFSPLLAGGNCCAMCGNAVYGGASYTLKTGSGNSFTLCGSCGPKLQSETASKRQAAIRALKGARHDLADAVLFDARNEHAKKNLQDISASLTQLGSPSGGVSLGDRLRHWMAW